MSQAQHGLTQVSRRTLNCAAFVDQPLESKIEVKATFTIWTVCEMLPNDIDFLGPQFPVQVKMETSDSLNTTHTIHQ